MAEKAVTLDEAEAMVAELESDVLSAMETGDNPHLEACVRLRLEWSVVRDRIRNGELVTAAPKPDSRLLN